MQTIHRHNKGVGREGGEGRGVEVSPTQDTKSFQVFVNIKLLTKSFNECMDSFLVCGTQCKNELESTTLATICGSVCQQLKVKRE